MINIKLKSLLYQRLEDEFKSYIDWYLTLPKENMLNHAYEYSIKQDILCAMEYYDVSEDDCISLLRSHSPLNDIYEQYNKLETGYMDDIRYSIDRVSRINNEKAKSRAMAR